MKTNTVHRTIPGVVYHISVIFQVNIDLSYILERAAPTTRRNLL